MTIANEEMAAAWDGEEGEYWAQHADRFNTASRRHWARFLDADLIEPSDVVLDIGCGTGKSTRDAARRASSGSALGIDLSSKMLELARERSAAANIANVSFEHGDAQVYPFDADTFDIAISSFGAMFFADPEAAWTNIGRAVRPGGRLAVLAWREMARNEWILAFREALAAGRDLPQPPPGAPGPFGLADADRAARVLDAAGFDKVEFEPVDEPVEFGDDGDDAFSFVRTNGIVKGLTHDLDDVTRVQVLEKLRSMLVEHETDEGVLLGTSAWLITARRR